MAPVLIVRGYVGIYRRKEYVGGATWGARGRGAPPPSWPPLLRLGVGSKSPGSYPRRKSRSKKDFSVWTPFDIMFLRNTEIGKKTAILGWASS